MSILPGEPGESRCRLPDGATAGEHRVQSCLPIALGPAGRPLQLLAGEHFCDGWMDFSCTAAAIHDPKSSETVGLIDITGNYKLIRSHLLPLIVQCALLIEEELTLLDGR